MTLPTSITLSVDCMGGDHGPSVTVPASVAFANREPDAHLLLVGRDDAVRAELRKAPVSSDVIQRARAPMLEAIDAVLKTNNGWLSLADRLQSKPDSLDRFARSRELVMAMSADDLLALARQYLDPDQGLEVLVLPEGVDP